MTFQTHIGSIHITTTLYGTVTAERVVRERMIAAHRAVQLGSFKKLERKPSFIEAMEDDRISSPLEVPRQLREHDDDLWCGDTY